MSDDIQAIRQQIGDFDTALKGAGIDPRYGLVTFPGNGPTPVQIQDLVDFATFTAVDSPFSTFAVPAGGSKEYGSLALREALNDRRSHDHLYVPDGIASPDGARHG